MIYNPNGMTVAIQLLTICSIFVFFTQCKITSKTNKYNSHNEKTGLWIESGPGDSSSCILTVSNYKNGLRNGRAHIFEDSTHYVGKYTKDKRQGRWKVYVGPVLVGYEYYATDVLSRIEKIKDGKLVETFITDPPF